MGRLGLTLITGPANAGKVRSLLERYLEALTGEPVLIVPNRPDVERVERELLARAAPARRLDRHLRRPLPADRLAVTTAVARVGPTRERRSLLRRAVAPTSLNGSRRLGALRRVRDALARRDSASSEPGSSSRTARRRPRPALRAYRAELERLGLVGPRAPARARGERSAATSTRGTASRCSPTASRI